ncbi:MAG: LysE family translocator [Pseudomonadota bacterium]|nr:LysE family translocator [Pseudomonadota bacterium]
MISIDFIVTSLVVVLIPGTGVIYTVATSIFKGRLAGIMAAFGCTMGIVPALLASAFGLAALFHASTLAFQILKYVGSVYLLYLAWQMWRSASPIAVGKAQSSLSLTGIATKGFLINILNPKLSIFFLAFLPQFVPVTAESTLKPMLLLGGIFMLMTFAVFVAYGFLSGYFRQFVVNSEKTSIRMQQVFATCFAGMGLRLAVS